MLKDFIKHSHINPSLIRAVVRQSGGWESFKEAAPDITRHGIDGGFHGWTWYSDTVKFCRRNKKLILELAENMAQDLGEGMLEMIQGFGVFRNDPISVNDLAKALYQGKGDDVTTVFNVMSWWVCEEVARSYDDWVSL